MTILTEEELSHLQEFCSSYKAASQDEVACAEWAAEALSRLKEVIAREQRRTTERGGQLGENLRQLLESEVVEQVKGRAKLSAETSLVSTAVQLLPSAVYVDVRLQIGVVK